MNSKEIWDFLKSQGLSDYAVAGIMGNLNAESGLRSNNLENVGSKELGLTDEQYTEKVDKGTYTKDQFVYDTHGYGLAQWTWWSRKKKLYEFAFSQGVSISSAKMQLQFLMQELKSGYKSVLDGMQKAKSVREASNIFLHKFESPADQSITVQNKRASLSQTFYDSYASQASSSQSASTIYASYTVQQGDTFESIAKKLGGKKVNAGQKIAYVEEQVVLKKTIDELATEVIQGKWGNGAERRTRLTEAGYNYNEVQARVDEIKGKKPAKKSIEVVAKEVIQGKWGNGKVRREQLEAAGYNYNEVQGLVDKMLGKI